MKKVSKKGLIWMAFVVVTIMLVSTATALSDEKEGTNPIIENEVVSLQNLTSEKGYELYANGSRQPLTTGILPGGHYFAFLLLENTALCDRNEFGFYYQCNITNITNGCRAQYRIFEGLNKTGDSMTFNTTDDNPATCDDFGLYLNAPAPHQDWHRTIGGLYFSENLPCCSCDNFSHFRISQCDSWPIYIIECEDWCGGGDESFDDMVVILVKLPS
jgi:hypothetical protein